MSEENICLDLFAGLGGFSQAFKESDNWRVVTVDKEECFNPDICADVLNLTPSDLPDPDIVLASPPCKAFSMMAAGHHLDSQLGEPKTEFGATSILLAHHTRGLSRALNPDYYIIENPMGGMRRELGKPDAHVWYCQYGSNRAKPTDLWGKLPPFDRRRCYNGNTDCHHQSSERGMATGTHDHSLTSAERAKVPYDLSKAILDGVEGRNQQQTLEQV